MELTKNQKELLFWVLQVFGWYLSAVFIFVLTGELSMTYIVYTFAFAGFNGIASTSIYRIYLKNNIDVELFGKASIKRLVLAFIIVSCFYFCLSFLSEELYEVFWTKTAEELELERDKAGLIIGIISHMVTVLLWTLIYFVIKFILKANDDTIRSIALNTSLKEAQLNTLKGQVNPHFMFNSLNNIRGLMLEDVEKSQDMITKLSEMLEYSLAKNSVDAIPLKEELEMVENYIALSKIQMEDRLQYVEEIDEQSLTIDIPPMIIQLLIENAVKHGIANLKDGGTISLKTKKDAQELSIIVSNTGKLRITEDSTQLGLKNIKQRLRLLYGEKASFSLEEVQNEVVAEIKIPLA